jgi:F-type H+-transporting ATPase subunit epsilon
MTQIVPGEIAVRKNNQDFFLAVGEGFVEITGDSVSILTDMAIKAQDIDEAKAEEARKRAEERLAGNQMSDEEVASVTAALAHSLAQLKVKRRQHH